MNCITPGDWASAGDSARAVFFSPGAASDGEPEAGEPGQVDRLGVLRQNVAVPEGLTALAALDCLVHHGDGDAHVLDVEGGLAPRRGLSRSWRSRRSDDSSSVASSASSGRWRWCHMTSSASVGDWIPHTTWCCSLRGLDSLLNAMSSWQRGFGQQSLTCNYVTLEETSLKISLSYQMMVFSYRWSPQAWSLLTLRCAVSPCFVDQFSSYMYIEIKHGFN